MPCSQMSALTPNIGSFATAKPTFEVTSRVANQRAWLRLDRAEGSSSHVQTPSRAPGNLLA
jgi:hypothetical protein